MSQGPELFVEEGMQAGLSAPLDLGTSMVGTHLESAVVIADPKLRPSHFEVVIQDGRTALRAVEGELLLPDGSLLAPGEDMICNEALSFTAGDTRFALRMPDGAMPEAEESLPESVAAKPRLSLAPGLLLAAAAGVALFTAVGLRGGHAPATQVASHTPAFVAHPSFPVAEVARGLRARLDAAGLAAVAVAPSGDGSVIVQGTLFPEQLAAWAPIRQWFDHQYGTNMVLVDEVLPASQGPQLTIAAVWAGANPYVIDDRGGKMFLGASIGNGWTIQDIQPGKVTVQNGQQKVALSY